MRTLILWEKILLAHCTTTYALLSIHSQPCIHLIVHIEFFAWQSLLNWSKKGGNHSVYGGQMNKRDVAYTKSGDTEFLWLLCEVCVVVYCYDITTCQNWVNHNVWTLLDVWNCSNNVSLLIETCNVPKLLFQNVVPVQSPKTPLF